MKTEAEFLTFLEFFKKFFWIDRRGFELCDLFRLGVREVDRGELEKALGVLKTAKANGFDIGVKNSIDRLINYTRRAYPKGYEITDHEEYKQIFSDFYNVYLNVKKTIDLNGKGPEARELLSSIYESSVARETMMYEFEGMREV